MGSPLANRYRNFCDAIAAPCISPSRVIGIDDSSVYKVIIDCSPLRTIDIHSRGVGLSLAGGMYVC